WPAGTLQSREFSKRALRGVGRVSTRSAGRITTSLLLALSVASLTLVAHPSVSSAAAYTTGRFTVSGNKILDPNGQRFVVRGADALYGWFAHNADSGGFGATNYSNAKRDLTHLSNAGYNLVRIDVEADQYYSSTPPNGSTFL